MQEENLNAGRLRGSDHPGVYFDTGSTDSKGMVPAIALVERENPVVPEEPETP